MTTAAAAMNDSEYRRGVTDLLGLLAYGELSAAERLGADATLAPTLAAKASLMKMATTEFTHFERLRDRLTELVDDPYSLMEEFAPSFERFHLNTAPRNWLEGMVKAYVGDGLAADFYREIAAFLDADTRALVLATLSDTGSSDFVIQAVREAITTDPKSAGPLALWGRRLMGEALSQAQMVVAERESLTAVAIGGVDRPGSMDLAAIGRMFTRLTEAHVERMDKLGLAA